MSAPTTTDCNQDAARAHGSSLQRLVPRPRPLLRYHGGKWVLAPWIIEHMPKHRTYVEPFGGAASVLLRKPRSYAEVYNELDGEIVNLFRVVRDRGDELRRLLELTPFARAEFVEAWERTDDPLESARRVVMRSFMGFSTVGATRRGKVNGTASITGFRSNVTRAGTTPAHDWRGYPDCLTAIIERLRGVVIENRPAAQVIETHDGPETLLYVDPPYVQETRDKGSDYNHEMTVDDHRALASQLNSVKAAVIVSGYACPLYDDELFVGWKRVTRETYADGARARTEVLWLRNVEDDGLLRGWSGNKDYPTPKS